MVRPWLILISLLSITVFYQNCGSPAGGGDQPAPAEKAQSLAATDLLASEVVSYLTLSGINTQNMTDEEIIREVLEQLENIAAGFPADSANRARVEQLIDLIRSSAEFRAMVVQAVRESTHVAPATPIPTPTPGPISASGPACDLDVRPNFVDRTQASSVKFTWTSQSATRAVFKYWDGPTQLSQNIALNGDMTLALRANFSPRPDIIPFNVMVMDARGIVNRCTIFIDFR